ncbi:cytochrome P450 [Pisolithus marmoratus]|nr:cytochrome P450 [Pisolithus marmoratus]
MFAHSIVIAVVFLTVWLWKRRAHLERRSRGLPLPPGPRRKPVIGNLLDIPRFCAWHKFLEWKEQYGELVYVEALGSRILILNSLEAVSDLLESRPANYSDRPTFAMVGELMGLDNSMPLLQYGDPSWRKQRKIAHLALSPEAVRTYDLVGDNVAKYVDSLLDKPDEFAPQLRLATGRIILSVTYGLPVDTPDDLAECTMEMIGKAMVPGTFLVDLIPTLKYLPAWFPFNNIHKVATSGRAQILELVTRPYEHVKRERAQGTAHPSFTSNCLDKSEASDPVARAEMEHVILWAAGSMYGAGGESSYSTTMSFILAMAMFPQVQAKLKEEVFRVVGSDRLPALHDRDAMPYMNAAVKEATRWKPALPLSIARRTKTADFYKGYYIPEDTIVLPNVWAISKDDKSGIPPEEFAPERHLASCVKETSIDPYSYIFGFGRRVCPGKYLGDNILFLLFSNIVFAVDISKKCDANGEEIPLPPSYSPGLVSFPEPFEVNISPSSRAAISVIKERVHRFS